MRIVVETTGFDTLELELLAFGDRAIAPQPALHHIASILREQEREVFATEGFGSWAPLAASTVEQKSARGLAPEILQATRHMKESLTEEHHVDHIEHVTVSELVFGTADEKAVFHAHGTSRMPKREPVMVRPETVVKATKTVQSWLVGEQRGTFGAGSFGMASLDPFGLTGQK